MHIGCMAFWVEIQNIYLSILTRELSVKWEYLPSHTNQTNWSNIMIFNLKTHLKVFSHTTNQSDKIFMNEVCNNHFQFQNIGEETTANIIDSLSPKTRCGFEGISTKVIE